MIEVKPVGSAYGLYNAAHELLKEAAAAATLHPEGRELALRTRDLYRRTETVTPHDTNTIEPTSRVICTVSGDIAVTFDGDGTDTAIVLASVPADTAGVVARANRIQSTSTTATGIKAVYEEDFR